MKKGEQKPSVRLPILGGYVTEEKVLWGEMDELRAEIFEFEQNMWTKIREDVKQWCLANWEKWDTEKPSWFVSSSPPPTSNPNRASLSISANPLARFARPLAHLKE